MKRVLCLCSLAMMFFLVPLAGSPKAEPRSANGEPSMEEQDGGGFHFLRRKRSDFAAIAYSRRTGSYGYAYNHPTRDSAEGRALKECGKRDCEVVVWVRNACAALAENRNGGIGWAWADSRDEARRAALARCHRNGGGNCRILCGGCS